MSAKKTADIALSISEEALKAVNSAHRGTPGILLLVIVILGYLFYINYYVTKDANRSSVILNMYKNTNFRTGVTALIILGMGGLFGNTVTRMAAIIGFAYVTSYVTLRNFTETRENMSDNKDMPDDLKQKLNNLVTQLYQSKLDNTSKDNEKNEKDEKDEKKVDVIPDEMVTENMQNYPLSREGSRCTPCKMGSRTTFNPSPHEPNSSLMGIGNDNLPPMGVDFLSAPPGVYSQSQIAYEMGMS